MSGKFEYVVIDDRSKEEKLKDKLNEAKEKVSEKAGEAINWTKNNWQAVLAGAAVAIPLATSAVKLVKSLKGSAADKHEERMKNCYYDPSTGLHWDLKRMLNNSERIELMQRKRDGEYTEDILMDMKLLKK